MGRTVLVVVHTVTSGQRLLDVVYDLESDWRVQVVYTIAPDVFNHGVERFLDELGAAVLPWTGAVRETFDLALAAAYGGLSELHAPVLVLAHGAGYGKFVGRETNGQPVVYGLDPQRLTRDGRVLAAAIVLSHESQRAILGRQCPAALDVAVVAGDPSFDRLLASEPWRQRYRDSLRLDDAQELVVVSSTWGPGGLFGRVPELLPQLMDQLPTRHFRVAALLHPAIWCVHGGRQIRAWLRDCRDAGLILLDPTEDWRAVVIAGDYLIGDHGSVTAYGAGLGRTVLQLTSPDPSAMSPGSAQQLVSMVAGRLFPDQPIARQLRTARPVDRDVVAAALTSRPGQADRLIRRAMYRLLRLTVPGRHRRPAPVPVPGRSH